MDRATYDDYLARFNARDYQGVLEFYADDFEIVFAGYRLRGRTDMLRFYTFFHQYVSESITVDRFICDAHTVALEGRVRLEGRRDLTPEILAEQGFHRLMGPRAGEVIEIPQFIHYHLKDGRIVRALCAVFEEPRD